MTGGPGGTRLTGASGSTTVVRRVRWASAVATGPLVETAGVLYFARLVATVSGVQEIVCILRDSTTDVSTPFEEEPVLLVLNVSSGGPDDWPKGPVAIRFARGLTAEFRGAGEASLIVGWDLG